MAGNKKTRNRKPSGPVTGPRMYFNAGTQDAIVEYKHCSSAFDREKIYVQRILPAFVKLVENLINIHKFGGLHDSFDDLKTDCVNFLFETIHKFDETRGTNAFSYFNVVAKNWLIIKTKQKQLIGRRNISMDDHEALSMNDKHAIEDYHVVQSQDEQLQSQDTVKSLINLLYELRTYAVTENELMCVNSIITVFENAQQLDILSKNAIFLYIREMSGLSPKQLTTALITLKKRYKELKGEDRFDLLD
jgi:hypothetical protein